MLLYTYIPFELIDDAIKAAIVRDRGLTYGAAIDAVRGIIDPLLRRGKTEFTLTINQLMDRGHSRKAARNAIDLLIGVIIEDTGETFVYQRSRPMRLFKLMDGFTVSKVPTNETELEEAVVRSGGTSAVLSAIKSQLKKEHGKDKVTTTMLRERYEELLQRTLDRQARNYHFARKGGI